MFFFLSISFKWKNNHFLDKQNIKSSTRNTHWPCRVNTNAISKQDVQKLLYFISYNKRSNTLSVKSCQINEMEARFLEPTAEFLLNSLLSRLKISVKIIILSFSDNLRIKTNVFTCYNRSSVSYFEIIPLTYCSECAWKQTQRIECTGYFLFSLLRSSSLLNFIILGSHFAVGFAKNSVNNW